MASPEPEGWLDGHGWTALEAKNSVALPHNFEELLLPSEGIIAEGRAVVLVNLDVAGTLLVTNFRLLFVGEKNQKDMVLLGTIPLATIEKFLKISPRPVPQAKTVLLSSPPKRLLQVVGKDMRNIVYGFRPRTKQRRTVFEALSRLLKSPRLWDLFAFESDLPPASATGDLQSRLRVEYSRIMSSSSGYNHSSRKRIVLPVKATKESKWWRVSEVNAYYSMSPSYPSQLIVPASVSDEEVIQAAGFRARGRLPVLSWRHGGNGAVLARSAQPLVGIMMNSRNNADEKVVAALCPPMTNASSQLRKLYIVDARPRKSALANSAMGGGSESSANYGTEVVFLGIENIHVMRDSFTRLRDYLDLHGGASSDGSSSLVRTGGKQWVGSTPSSMSAAVSALGDSGWLMHVHSILSSAAWIAGRLALEASSVLIHCSDGWDRTSQLISLAELLLDPYYRTFKGFQALVEKDWLSFGHPFADRLGAPTFTGGSNLPTDILRQTAVDYTSPGRNGPGSPAGTSSQGGVSSDYSPVFLQWADCVAQLLRLYPRAFEYSSIFLVELVDVVLSCRFGNFLCNNERERVQSGIADSSPDIWSYLEQKRAAGRSKHEHYNILYDPTKHSGALLPPAAILAPLLWPQYYMRWACPSDLDVGGGFPTGLGQGGDLEKEARVWAVSLSLVQRSKEKAERQLEEALAAKRALEEQLHKERKNKTSALTSAGRAQEESAALKRVLNAMGVHIRISKAKSTDYSEGEVNYDETFDDSDDDPDSGTGKQYGQTVEGEHVENRLNQLAVSVSMQGDSGAYHLRKACDMENGVSCSSQKLGDPCKWPQCRCARLSSALVGLKADFTALEQSSVGALDYYFDPDQKDTGPTNGQSQLPGIT